MESDVRFLQLRSTFQPVPQTTKPTLAFLKQMLQLYKQLVSQTLPLFKHFSNTFTFFKSLETLSISKHLHLPNSLTFQTSSLSKYLHFSNTFSSEPLLLPNNFHFPNTFTFQTLSLSEHCYFPNTFTFQTLLLPKYFHFPTTFTNNQAYLQK